MIMRYICRYIHHIHMYTQYQHTFQIFTANTHLSYTHDSETHMSIHISYTYGSIYKNTYQIHICMLVHLVEHDLERKVRAGSTHTLSHTHILSFSLSHVHAYCTRALALLSPHSHTHVYTEGVSLVRYVREARACIQHTHNLSLAHTLSFSSLLTVTHACIRHAHTLSLSHSRTFVFPLLMLLQLLLLFLLLLLLLLQGIQSVTRDSKCNRQIPHTIHRRSGSMILAASASRSLRCVAVCCSVLYAHQQTNR